MRKLLAVLAAATVLMAGFVFSSPALGSDAAPTAAERPILTTTSRPGSILLEWTAAQTDGVVGYMIRRGTDPGREDMWPVNDFPAVGKSYLDQNVNPGETYYYVIIPVLVDGSWGKSSREASGQAGAIPPGHTVIQLYLDAMAQTKVATSEGMVYRFPEFTPLLYRGRVMMALPDIVAITGADLTYNSRLGVITHRAPTGRVMQMSIGSDALIFTKATRHDTCTPIKQDEQVYLPIRWIVEAMGGYVDFDTASRAILIDLPQ